MVKAVYTDKDRVVDILSSSFIDNKSVNYAVKQDKKRLKRIKHLMDYSFDVCWHWGEIYLSENKSAAALIINPLNKKSNLKSILLDIKLVFRSVGLSNIKKVLSRESMIKKSHPKNPYFHLWFLGVDANEQGKGIGSKLLTQIIEESSRRNYPIYIETSTLKNIPFYEKLNFQTYLTVDLGFTLYLMKHC